VGKPISAFAFGESIKPFMIDAHVRRVSQMDKKTIGLEENILVSHQCF